MVTSEQLASLRDAIEADVRRLADGEAGRDRLTTAVGYWTGFPWLLEFIGFDWGSDPQRKAAYYALTDAHREAVRVLMLAAECVGLDSGPLWAAGELVQRLYHDDPERYFSGRFDTFPECIPRDALSADDWQRIEWAEAVIRRLDVRTDQTKLETHTRPGGKGEQSRKRGAYRTGYDPEADAKLDRDWKAAKAAGTQTVAEFCKARGLDEIDTREALERHRGRQKRRAAKRK